MASAFIGQPPATQDDYWVVRSLLLAAGLSDVDPNQGAKIPPPRPPPHLYRFETKGPAIIAGASISITLMVVVTLTRLLFRWFGPGVRFGADDWLIIPGVVLAVAWPVLQILIVLYAGGGKPMYDVTYHELYIFNWLASVCKLIFFVSVGFIKMSITMFNMRLTGLTSRKWMIAHWSFFAILVAYVITAFFMNVFQCIPPSANFDHIAAGKRPTKAKCLSEGQLTPPLNIMHAITDFCLLAVPIIVLWNVQFSWSKKLRLYLVFSIGIMSCIGSVVRQFPPVGVKDAFRLYYHTVIWTLIDITCAVLVASLPLVSTILPRFWRKATKARSGPGDKSNSYNRPRLVKNSGSAQPDDSWSHKAIVRQDDIELSYDELELGDPNCAHSNESALTTTEFFKHPRLGKSP